MRLFFFLPLPNLLRSANRDLGTFLPDLYKRLILFRIAANLLRLLPEVPDKYFFGSLLRLSFGTLLLGTFSP